MSPVPPTQSNWQVHRAFQDGEARAYAFMALFFDPETIEREARDAAMMAEKSEKHRKPLGDDVLRLA